MPLMSLADYYEISALKKECGEVSCNTEQAEEEEEEIKGKKEDKEIE